MSPVICVCLRSGKKASFLPFKLVLQFLSLMVAVLLKAALFGRFFGKAFAKQ